MDASHIHMAKDDDSESHDIVDLLPPRFREITASSTAMERFNFLNNDLISARIIPALHCRLPSLIPNARPALIADRLRSLVDSAPPPSKKCSLLFRPVVYSGVDTGIENEIKFLDCPIRDKRLPPFPNHELERRALIIPEEMKWDEYFMEEIKWDEDFMESIGHKVIYWRSSGPDDHACYIMNAGNNSDGAFRALDISTVVGDISTVVREFQGQNVTLIPYTTVVGDRLILLFDTVVSARLIMFSLDVNTERWSVLPACEYHGSSFTLIPWKGKLYLVDLYDLVNRRNNPVPMHFDFQRNVWVEGDDLNRALCRRLRQLPRVCFQRQNPNSFKERLIISSKSGTLYAVTREANIQYPIGAIYAMDDLATGWRRIERRKSVHSKQVNPFRLPNLQPELAQLIEGGSVLDTRVRSWEINEHDIFLVILQYSYIDNPGPSLCARYAWWIFNEDDGVKSYGGEDLSGSRLVNEYFDDISVLKVEYEF